MSQANKTPAYNLKVVIQLTGIKPDTLRAWERRYGLPLPERTPGGHRLYSQYDIGMIKWLMARQEEGMRINRAIELFRSIEADGNDPLDSVHPIERPAQDINHTMVIGGASLDDMRARWVEACLSYDEPGVEWILSQSFAVYPVELVCLEVLQRGISEIGDLWYQGKATVQQEHFASALVLRRLDALIAASPTPTKEEKILIGCPSQEEHVLAALIATLFLRRHGWDVIYLGANVPLENLEQAVQRTSAELVILLASQLNTAANLYTAACSLQSAGIPVAFAGSIFSMQVRLKQRIPGYYLGEHLERIVNEVEIGLKIPSRAYDILVSRNEYQLAKSCIEDHQAAIKADIWNELHQNGISDQIYLLVNDTLMQDILSALTLDSLDSLEMEIEWVKVLLEHQRIPPGLLYEYLKVYAESIDRHAGEEAIVVSDWLRSIGNKYEVRL